MTPVISLILVLIIQIMGYIFFYKMGIKGWRYVLLVLLLVICVEYLPNYFISKVCIEREPGYYMDAPEPYFFFGISAGGLVVLTHLTFWAINRFYSKR
ncbi:hypothetical protein [Myroides sp. N17-2]|uniref:hypothetical protein n=1 Tax=Myroides sp. N17-2 TaxID=2030799 RepID=UPI000EFC0C87|nr:hypothetical protein [Myroides sp. N17-2]